MTLVRTQDQLDITIETPLGKDAFIVDSIEIDDELSQPFCITLKLHASKPDLKLKDLLFKSINILIKIGDKKYNFNGNVSKASLDRVMDDSVGLIAFYTLIVRPQLWFLKLTLNFRIFQNKSVLDIIKTILRDNNINQIKENINSCGKETREYCVQYRESDFDFISRLMEEEGIFYFFEHDKNKHTIILCDNHSQAHKVGVFSCALVIDSERHMDQIYNVSSYEEVGTKTFKACDHNYEKEATNLAVRTQRKEEGSFGTFYDYPGLYTDISQGADKVKRWSEVCEWQSNRIKGQSTILGLSCGSLITLKDHFNKTLNTSYVVNKVSHRFNQFFLEEHKGAEVYQNTFSAFPSTKTFRPPRLIPRPIAYSSQTAIVTGPENEEIYCDKSGRIKVQFYWDELGRKNENSSCWIRVAQNWAGAKWGGLITPRIGMEVVVNFIEGNPDRPLITACVYNSVNTAPEYAENAPTKSTFRTNSSKGGGGFNELRFEDKKNSEEIYFHGQKDFNTVIENSRTETINKSFDKLTVKKSYKEIHMQGNGIHHLLSIEDKGDDQTKIKNGNQTLEIEKGDQKIILKQGNQIVEIDEGDQKVTIKSGNANLTLDGGNLTIKVTGNISMESTGNMSFDAKGSISMSAVTGITIKSDTTLTAQGTAVTVKSDATMTVSANAAMTISANASLTANTSGAMTISGSVLTASGSGSATVSGGGALTLSGGAVIIG